MAVVSRLLPFEQLLLLLEENPTDRFYGTLWSHFRRIASPEYVSMIRRQLLLRWWPLWCEGSKNGCGQGLPTMILS
jgi:hypothetical protein